MNIHRETLQNKIAGLSDVSECLNKAIAAYEAVLVWWDEKAQNWISKEYIAPLVENKREVDLEIKYLKDALEGDQSARK